MTPRSRRYFNRKKYGESLFIKLMQVFEAIQLAKDACLRLTAPIPKYSSGMVHSGSCAIVGEIGPELVEMADGRMVMTRSRIYPRFEPSKELRSIPSPIIPEGLFDVKITNAFTPSAERSIKKIDNIIL